MRDPEERLSKELPCLISLIRDASLDGVKREGTCCSKGKIPACAKVWKYERSRMGRKSCSVCLGGRVGGKTGKRGWAAL